MTTEEFKTYLYEMGISPENVGYICGYFSDKPEHWKEIFILRSQGRIQEEIADEISITQQAVSWVINQMQCIQVFLCN